MIWFVFYDSTGLITQMANAYDSEDVDLQMETFGLPVVLMSEPLDDTRKYHVSEGELHLRSELNISMSKSTVLADGVDSVTLEGFPDPCQIIVEGVEHTLTGGTLILRADTPTTYQIECRHWPYLDWSTTIEAV